MVVTIRQVGAGEPLISNPVIDGDLRSSFGHIPYTMPDSVPSRTPRTDPVPAEADTDSDEEVFHDARFPAEEEAVS